MEELISPTFRIEFREFCVVNLVLRTIHDFFRAAGIPEGESTDTYLSGERRNLVAAYYASIDWTNIEAVRKFLQVVTIVLSQSYISEEEKADLRSICEKEGLVIDGFTLRLGRKGGHGRIKNLIFAADGPKPEIVITDSTTNDIQIVRNEEYCLVYDKPILEHGLLWRELIDWWKEQKSTPSISRAEIDLHTRLCKSLANGPEKLLFNTYFTSFRHVLADDLPALIPQVYLHYDPYTLRQRGGIRQLLRQRMDFLMLLPDDNRIVIEIDGKQHYAQQDGRASPSLYAEMVAEDRRLKIAGYDVYRFGGYEFFPLERGTEPIKGFFSDLFERYAIRT